MATPIDNGELPDITAALHELPDDSLAPKTIATHPTTGEPLDPDAPIIVEGTVAAGNEGSQQSSYSDNTSHTLIAAGGVGVRRNIFMLTIANTDTTNGTTVSISDGTKTRKYRVGPNSTFGLALSGGNYLKASSTAADWTLQSSASVALEYSAEFIETE